MVGINKPQNLLNKLENTRLGHFDKWMNKYYKNQTISDNFGINFVDRKSFLDWGMPKVLQKQSKLFIEGEREKIPLAFKRRRDYR